MITVASSSGKTTYGIKEYCLDTPSDLNDLIKNDDAPGSTAIIISTSEKYILNGQGQWILQPMTTDGGGSGTAGKPGVSIVGVTVDDNNNLTCTMSNGTTIEAGQIKTKPGKDGVSIKLVSINKEGHLICTLSNNEIIDGGLLPAGEDGISPTITTTPIDGGTKVTITDAAGIHEFNVMNGSDGGSIDVTDGFVLFDKLDGVPTINEEMNLANSFFIGKKPVIDDIVVKNGIIKTNDKVYFVRFKVLEVNNTITKIQYVEEPILLGPDSGIDLSNYYNKSEVDQKIAESKEQISISWDDIENKPNVALKTDIVNVYRFKGSVSNFSSLPIENIEVGDVYDVIATDMNYGWTGTKWDPLGQVFEIQAITNEEIDNIIGG